MRPQDKHIWFSSSKVAGSTVMALLEQQGKIDIKKPVSDYIAELKGSEWDTVMVEEALDMANGLDSTEHDEPVQDTRTNPDQVYYQWGVTLGFFVNPDQKERDPFMVMRGMKRKYPGHTAFEYNSINTWVMNRINERVGGKPVNELFSEMVWSKIGAEHDMELAISPQGYLLLFGFTTSTLRDMARFGMIFTPSWNKVAKEKVVSDKQMKCIQTLGNPKAYQGSGEEAYGKRWFGETPYMNTAQWDHAFEDGAMFKHGNMGQGIYVDPARDFCGIYFGLATNDEAISGADHSPGYLRTAAKLLAGK